MSLNRETIKYIAIFIMLLNHILKLFIESGSLFYELFLDLGHFTAITMCYFLVEGFYRTHSRKKYALRLLIFAIISEIPYCLAFTKNGILEFVGLNMLFSLFICFLILTAIENISSKSKKINIIIGLIFLSLFSDWALSAPLFTLLFVWARGSKNKTKIAFIVSSFLYGTLKFICKIEDFSLSTNIIYSLGDMLGIILSGITIVYLYNGKQMNKSRKFSKWFFYLFYPVHLLILGVIRILCL